LPASRIDSFTLFSSVVIYTFLAANLPTQEDSKGYINEHSFIFFAVLTLDNLPAIRSLLLKRCK
jgi:hypothetical protein